MAANDDQAVLVLVVEDNPFNADGLVMYLTQQGYRSLVAGDRRTAVEVAAAQRPDLAIVDIVLPTTPLGPADPRASVGLDVVRLLKELDPSMGVVIFSAHEDRAPEVYAMVEDGMRGLAYLLKGNQPERMIAALEATAAGHVLLEPDQSATRYERADEMLAKLSPEERPLVEYAARHIYTLSLREADVAWRLAASHTNQNIAAALGLSPKTIETNVGHIYRKLGLNVIDADGPLLRKSTLLAKACMLYQYRQKP